MDLRSKGFIRFNPSSDQKSSVYWVVSRANRTGSCRRVYFVLEILCKLGKDLRVIFDLNMPAISQAYFLIKETKGKSLDIH
jgi:hypothetical protein